VAALDRGAWGGETRRYLLDFGFRPEVYANNLELLKIDPAAVDALILSHGHFDHMGGLIGFLEAQRPKHRRQNQGERVNRCSGKASPALAMDLVPPNALRTADRSGCRLGQCSNVQLGNQNQARGKSLETSATDVRGVSSGANRSR
jgi:glyoxylase-like metal-dependent hydrolase (beta-lactamase superfamily II)